MLAISQVNEIRRLLAGGDYSQRKIARMTGVSRGTIGAIALGRRPDYESRSKEEDETALPLGPLGRCKICGAKVYLPCRLCELRRQLALERKKTPAPGPIFASLPPEPLGLDLREEHRRRYEEVRLGRLRGKKCESLIIGCGLKGDYEQ